MAIGQAGRRRLQTHEFAPVHIVFVVQAGTPESAFDEDGILDVDQLIELGWTIDDNAESFNPPGESAKDTEQPERNTPVHSQTLWWRRGGERRSPDNPPGSL